MKRIIKNSLIILAALVFAVSCMSACSKSYSPASDYRPAESVVKPNYDSSVSFNGSGENADTSDVFSGRKVIRNADLTVQTLDFDNFMSSLGRRISEMGGYYESSSVDRSGYYERMSLRSATMTVRIPAEKLDEFLAEVDGLGNVTRRDESVLDVTESYEDTEARLAAVRTEYDSLLELLSKATSLDEIFKLQERLSEVRYQMESYESKLRNYDSRIEYSSVKMYVQEVIREDPTEPESFGEEVSRRFNESLTDVGNGFKSFAKWFIGNLPHIVTTLVLLAVPVILIVLLATAPARRRAKLNREYEAKKAASEKEKAESASDTKGDE